jgi:hypothetical protein
MEAVSAGRLGRQRPRSGPGCNGAEAASTHEKQKQREKNGLGEMLKTIERRHLRTGRTKATKLRAEMSELLNSC